MNGREYERAQRAHIEQICREHFCVDIQISSIVASDVETKDNSYTTVFQAGSSMYAFCETEKPMYLRDVKSIIRLMGMEAEYYYPPEGDMQYFARYGKKAFLSVFPGREIKTDDDTRFYQMMAPYSPALVRIAKVSGGIRRFNVMGNSWQTVKDFSYTRIQVQ